MFRAQLGVGRSHPLFQHRLGNSLPPHLHVVLSRGGWWKLQGLRWSAQQGKEQGMLGKCRRAPDRLGWDRAPWVNAYVWSPLAKLPLSSTAPRNGTCLFIFLLSIPELHTRVSVFPGHWSCACLSSHGFSTALFFIFIFFISWRQITLQYYSGFCHTLKWISHGFTYVPHPDHPSHLPLHPIPLGLPSAPGLSTCLMHPTWAGDLFHPR